MAPLHNAHTGIQKVNSHYAKQFDIKKYTYPPATGR